ncbi:MAG: alkaline phosphatase family protein [Nitrospirae bacterium]|nr:alkaline phosphatase family protein [Nitrospirota bacterium]
MVRGQAVILPEYHAGSIVNLMASLIAARGGEPSPYAPLPALDPSRLHGATNLVLLVVDGLGYDYLTTVGAGGALHHHLKDKITTVFPATTVTAITTFLTGMAPQQHALTGWFMHFKEVGGVTAVLPFTPRHGGPPLAKSGVDPAALFGHVPVFDRMNVRTYAVLPKRIVDSEFNVAHSGRAERRSYRSLKRFFKTIAEISCVGDHPKYVYAYWSELDAIAHESGIASRKAAAHFAEFDAAFGAFVKTMAGSDSLIVVTGDHGFIDSAPDQLIELDRHPALAETLMLPLCGDRRVAYCYVHPAKRGQFEQYVRAELSDYAILMKSAALIDQEYFGLGPPHPRLSERIGDYTLLMKGHYAIKDWVPGERKYSHIGLHGSVSREEMYVPLVVAEA